MCSDLYCTTVFPNICITFVSSLFSMRTKNLLHWRDVFSTLPIIPSLLPVPRPCQMIILTWFSTWSFLPKLWRYLSAYLKTKPLHNVPTQASFYHSVFFPGSTFSVELVFLFVCLLSDPTQSSPHASWLLFCPHHSGEATQEDPFWFPDPMTSQFCSLTGYIVAFLFSWKTYASHSIKFPLLT